MFSIEYAFYLFFLAFSMAVVEIQIEGKNGWAENLPCWRPKPNSWIAKVYSLFMQGKPLTGYHLAANAFAFLMMHFPFAAGVSWSLSKELETISYLFLMAICEDFLWFVLNPFYGLKNFRKDKIWWHKEWLEPIPIDYFYGICISIAVSGSLGIIFGSVFFIYWLITFFILSALLASVVIIQQI